MTTPPVILEQRDRQAIADCLRHAAAARLVDARAMEHGAEAAENGGRWQDMRHFRKGAQLHRDTMRRLDSLARLVESAESVTITP